MSLSDKIFEISNTLELPGIKVIRVKDIKDSLKRIELKLLKKFKMASVLIMQIIKEEMGEKLI